MIYTKIQNRIIKTRTTHVKSIQNEETIMAITVISLITTRVIMTIIIITLTVIKMKYKKINQIVKIEYKIFK